MSHGAAVLAPTNAVTWSREWLVRGDGQSLAEVGWIRAKCIFVSDKRQAHRRSALDITRLANEWWKSRTAVKTAPAPTWIAAHDRERCARPLVLPEKIRRLAEIRDHGGAQHRCRWVISSTRSRARKDARSRDAHGHVANDTSGRFDDCRPVLRTSEKRELTARQQSR